MKLMHLMYYFVSAGLVLFAVVLTELSLIESFERDVEEYSERVQYNVLSKTDQALAHLRVIRNHAENFAEAEQFAIKDFKTIVSRAGNSVSYVKKMAWYSFSEIDSSKNFIFDRQGSFDFHTEREEHLPLPLRLEYSYEDVWNHSELFSDMNEGAETPNSSFYFAAIPFRNKMQGERLERNALGVLVDYSELIGAAIDSVPSRVKVVVRPHLVITSRLLGAHLKNEVHIQPSEGKDGGTELFESIREFKHSNVNFILSISAKTEQLFAYPPSMYFVTLFFIFVLCILVMSLVVLIFDSSIKMENTLVKLTDEIELKIDAQKSLNLLNKNLEKEVVERTNELMLRNKNIQSFYRLFPDLLFNINKSGDVLSLETSRNKSANILSSILSAGMNIKEVLSNNEREVMLNAVNLAIDGDKLVINKITFKFMGMFYTYECRHVKYNEDSAISICRDITEEVELEKQISQQNMKALNHARLASLGEMAGGIAHEINNPLTIIDGSADILKTMMVKKDFDFCKAENSIQRIQTTVQRIAKIIKGLKKFSRNKDVEFEWVEVGNFFDEVLSFCKERFNSSGVHLSFELNNLEKTKFHCNQVELSQVLINLLNNAFDAVVTEEEKWVKLQMKEEDQAFIIKIIDSGPGISKELKDKVMQPFFTTKKVGHGTGLGLSISKSIIEGHRGELIIDESSDYSCFKITLPKFNIKGIAAS